MVKFFIEEIDFVVPKPIKTRKLLTTICKSNSCNNFNLNYIFCNDAYLLEINKQYLDHDYFTDIITFNNSESEELLEGDIYISIDRVTENATDFKTPFEVELRRVMIHGLLHLLGFDDTTEALKTQMRLKEDEYLQLF